MSQPVRPAPGRIPVALPDPSRPAARHNVANPPLRNWRLLPHDRAAVERLARSLQTSPPVAQLLLNRGVHETEHARQFLAPSLKGLHRPELLPGVPDAVDRILAAIDAGRKI